MTDYLKGGRGNKAPYESTHVRVPLPIKDKVESIINEFKNTGEVKTEQKIESDFVDFDKAVEIAKSILVSKKSAKVSLQKLLTGIYGFKDIEI